MTSQFIPAVRVSLSRRAVRRAQPGWSRWLRRALLRSRRVRRLLQRHEA